jgi:hypothetical protein
VAQKLVAGFPPDYDLPANFIIQLNAVDPTTGATVAGVKVSNVAIVASPVTPDTSDSGIEFVPTNPLWLPAPLADQGEGA